MRTEFSEKKTRGFRLSAVTFPGVGGHSQAPFLPDHTIHQLEKQKEKVERTELTRPTNSNFYTILSLENILYFLQEIMSLCTFHTKHWSPRGMTKAILLLSSELESELAPEERAAGSGHLVCSALSRDLTTGGVGRFHSNLGAPAAPPDLSASLQLILLTGSPRDPGFCHPSALSSLREPAAGPDEGLLLPLCYFGLQVKSLRALPRTPVL